MFGYIQPHVPDLRVCEHEQWKAAYCGLCGSLAENYGHLARYLVNYDLTFLALLFSGLEGGACMEQRRCPYSPWKKRLMCTGSDSFTMAADICVLLSWWRLRDMADDSNWPKSAAYNTACRIFSRGHKLSAQRFPDLDSIASSSIDRLRDIERSKLPAIDPGADTFAQLLSKSANAANAKHRRPLELLLYHIGRWIYIVDACDDLSRDIRSGNYNPLACLYGRQALTADNKQHLSVTLEHSAAIAASAYELLDFGACSGVIGNILYLGLPAMANKVLSDKNNDDKDSVTNPKENH